MEILISRALAEDIGSGDITTACTVSPGAEGKGRIVAREPLVLAGSTVARQIFLTVEPSLDVTLPLQDGNQAMGGEALLGVTGNLAAMLTAERTALNFLQRLSGIATLTQAFVDKVAGISARILDTRKTTPGYRLLEKAAVRAGGGYNHRFGLYDGVLIKDNHIAAAGSIQQALKAARTCKPKSLMAEAVRRTGGKVPLEASGGITLDNVREVAATGVDLISVGALTHSARAVDMSMEIEPLS